METSPNETLLLRVSEAARQLGISERKVYHLLRSRELRSITIGRRRLIPREAVRSLIADRLVDEGGCS
jgi:excisionase family DNA binding protein